MDTYYTHTAGCCEGDGVLDTNMPLYLDRYPIINEVVSIHEPPSLTPIVERAAISFSSVAECAQNQYYRHYVILVGRTLYIYRYIGSLAMISFLVSALPQEHGFLGM